MSHRFITLGLIALASACAAAATPAQNRAPEAQPGMPPPPPIYTVTKTLPVGGDEPWVPWSAGQVAVDGQAHLLYVPRISCLQVIDVNSGKVIAEIPGNGAQHVVLVPALSRGYFSNSRNATVTIFDLKTHQSLGNVAVDKSPSAIIYDPFSKHILVACLDAHNIRTFRADIDPKTGKAQDAIELDGSASALVADGFGMVYATLSNHDEVAVVDTRHMAVATSWLIARWLGPTSIAMDRKHGRLYIGCRASILIIAAADGQQVGDVHIPSPNAWVATGGLAFRDGLAYASNGEGFIYLIGQTPAGKFERQGSFPVPKNAWGFAMDSKSGAIYLPASSKSESHSHKVPGLKLVVAEIK